MMYSEAILDYANSKRFRGKLNDATVIEEGKNISCGDEITLYLKVEDGVVKDAKFEGMGCVISQASASLMLERIVGERVEEIFSLIEEAEKMSRGENFDEGKLKNVTLMSDIKNYPARVKCFILAWKTLKEALKKISRP
ncbi:MULTISPECIES: Fe-S cluster assembly sulfur transfer protein SufU [unclassified Thermotoga]|jgi:nitrogen fixation NifU-like protein|uniref:Fe-S cluster assembly sulfur transfer protein SufU n=1 Tax=unclassified Thermotoga TaxID=2631113 RepID=UPI000280E705|nr:MULTISPECIES: SUF system NifU family Fe-S cluster assembly protein [unclassified Thermotoga]AIY86989.1 SUF system FeS assembly protein, NifU family [Thermotoga sp. 2812B]EJX25706.1 SUF system FeS assembly protein, NifU family [Thermotoga sp. EMP]